ncbi:WXG100 family type VII secretion target [Actinopolyspora saharensis]|uniref:Proteins of 100 residues with WXG n=1 Tax=Actinopolyspora saharensis TaxID=995062 RepID=A0A1H0YQM8_9ACTN|nr:WXG100 family type VII secretion target [Actinopolyspora saharensis]SDQ17527.1 Proteins of 100 residues with WXG [Actinopolyspora saharensis]
MSTPSGADQSSRSEASQLDEHHTLETAAAAVAAADPQQFYRDGQHFEATAQRLRTVSDGLRRELRRVEGAWQGPGAEQFRTTAQQITDTVEQLAETLTAPSYSALHGHLGDAVSNAGRQLRQLRSQRESGRQAVANDPAMAATPEGQQQLQHQEQAQDEHARLVLRDLATIYQQVGGQLRELPTRSTRGTQVRSAVHRDTGEQTGTGTDALTATTGGGFTEVIAAPAVGSAVPATGSDARAVHSNANNVLGRGGNIGGEQSPSENVQPTTRATGADTTSEASLASTAPASTGAVLAGSGALGRGGSNQMTGTTSDNGERGAASLESTDVPGVLSAPGAPGTTTTARGRERDRQERLQERGEGDSAPPATWNTNDPAADTATPGTAFPVPGSGYSSPSTPTSHTAPVPQGDTATGRAAKPVSSTATPPSRVSTVASPSTASTTGGLGSTTSGGITTGATTSTTPGRLANSAEVPSGITAASTARTGPPASPGGLGGAPAGSVPPTGGAGTGNQDNRERDRNTLQHEDEDVWGGDGDSGGVLGR